jgi:hypothetical protein
MTNISCMRPFIEYKNNGCMQNTISCVRTCYELCTLFGGVNKWAHTPNIYRNLSFVYFRAYLLKHFNILTF